MSSLSLAFRVLGLDLGLRHLEFRGFKVFSAPASQAAAARQIWTPPDTDSSNISTSCRVPLFCQEMVHEQTKLASLSSLLASKYFKQASAGPSPSF